jgi:alkanesulfonate monooxygenase SsuD/methylene tetrahydromethanopterin reductase-like flavin-dependent oxidoreductase (luciferase family)
VLGVGTGYLQPEFDALGVPFEHRNDDMDEAIEVMRAVWSGEPVSRKGRSFSADGISARPLPDQVGGPPVWVGGNSRRAIRRAVELGDAWMPFPNPSGRWSIVRTATLMGTETLREGTVTAQRLMTECGRERPLPLVYPPLGREMYDRVVEPERLLASASEMAELGLSHAIIGIPALTIDEFLRHVDEYGRHLLPRLAEIEPGAIRPS